MRDKGKWDISWWGTLEHVGWDIVPKDMKEDGGKEERCQQQQVFRKNVEGANEKLEMVRNGIGVYFLHDFVRFDAMGTADGAYEALESSTIWYGPLYAWTAMVMTFHTRKKEVQSIV